MDYAQGSYKLKKIESKKYFPDVISYTSLVTMHCFNDFMHI